MKSKLSRVIVLISLIFISFVFPVLAQEYPNKPVTLVIPYPAGGSTDVTGRVLATAVGKFLGQPIIVENKSGGGGTVGVNLVITRPADGYTLGIFPSAPIAVAAHMGKLNFHPLDDMTHILRYSGYTFGIVVRADSAWKTVQDFLQYAKQNPQKVSFGSPGVGTTGHLAMEELSMLAGVRLIHVPYKGVAETNTALLGGHVDIVSDSSGWAPMVDAGKFRLLATYAQQRLVRYPQVPTLKEVGYDLYYSSPLEIIGPRGLPRAVVEKVHEAFKKGMDEPDYQNTLKKFDMPNIYLNAEDVEKADRQEYERLGKVVLKLGLQPK